jgi:hypothetical protein
MNGTAHLKNVNNCLNTNIYSYLETSDGQSSTPYLNVVHFLTPVLIRHLWQLKTVVFLNWCIIHSLLLSSSRTCKLCVGGAVSPPILLAKWTGLHRCLYLL